MGEIMTTLLKGAGLTGKDAVVVATFIIGTCALSKMIDGVMEYVKTGDTV